MTRTDPWGILLRHRGLLAWEPCHPRWPSQQRCRATHWHVQAWTRTPQCQNRATGPAGRCTKHGGRDDARAAQQRMVDRWLAGATQAEIAAAVGLSAASVSAIIRRGVRRLTVPERWVVWARACRIPGRVHPVARRSRVSQADVDQIQHEGTAALEAMVARLGGARGSSALLQRWERGT